MANGNFGGGDGTPENPYLIEDLWDLNAIRSNAAMRRSHYKMVRDIDFSNYPNVDSWSPIDNFEGVLDGNGHYIFNLYIQHRVGATATNHQVGFLTNLSGVIKGLTFVKPILDYTRTGAGSGHFRIAVISSSLNPTSRIERCAVEGGVINAVANTSLSNSVQTSSRISLIAGGTLGASNSDYPVVSNCYAAGSIVYPTGEYFVGGVIGRTTSRYIVENCYARVKLISLGSNSINAGALVGDISSTSRIVNCFWDSSIESSAGNPGSGPDQTTGTPLTTEQMQESKHFTAWDSAYHEDDEGNLIKTWTTVNGYFPKLSHQIQNRMQLIDVPTNTEITSLDFGYIVAGSRSSIMEITLRSRYLVALRVIDISWIRNVGISDKTRLKLSRTEEPFEDLDRLTIIDELDYFDEMKLYAQVDTDIGLETGGAFRVNVNVIPK